MKEQLFYCAQGARTGDVIPKYIDGKYQLFYLKGWKNPDDPNRVDGWHRMESEDLIHMGPETPTGVVGGTGDLIFWQGKWHLFACIFPDGKQYVTHYVSVDNNLDRWELQEDILGPDGDIYDCSDWRDPRIVYKEEAQEFWMFLAARANDRHSQTGCVGLCVSKDLYHWEYREPAYYPKRFKGACECPDIFTIGEWEYLIFSNYTNLFGTYYVKRKRNEREWELPVNHRLDGRGFYAAKTAGNDKERYLFGWNPSKDEDLFGFWPEEYKGKDYQTWDWGGNMVIHRIIQQGDGDLGLALPEKKRDLFCREICNVFEPVTDGWKMEAGQIGCTTKAEQQMMLMQKLPDTYYLCVAMHDCGARQMGVMLQIEKDMEAGYYIYLEPEKSRMVFRSPMRMSEEGGKMFPYDTEIEVPVKKCADGSYVLEVMAEESIGVAYVNGEAAMSFRMYDYRQRRMGVFALGKARFEEISVFAR